MGAALGSSPAAARSAPELAIYSELSLELRPRHFLLVEHLELYRGYLKVDPEDYALAFRDSPMALDAFDTYETYRTVGAIFAVASLVALVASFVALRPWASDGGDEQQGVTFLFMGISFGISAGAFGTIANHYLLDAVNHSNRDLLKNLADRDP